RQSKEKPPRPTSPARIGAFRNYTPQASGPREPLGGPREPLAGPREPLAGPREPPLTLTLSPPPTPYRRRGEGTHASCLSRAAFNSHFTNPLSPPVARGLAAGRGLG